MPDQPAPNNAWRRKRVTRGLCADCGQPRVPAAALLATATRCGACAAKHRERARAYQRRRNPHAIPRVELTSPPLPFGGAAPRINAVINLRVRVDRETLAAIDELKRRDLAARKKAGLPWQPFQLSRIVRAALRQWETRPCPPRTPYRRFLIREFALNLHLDARTLAIVEHQAHAHFDGCRTAAIRALIVASAAPPIIPVVAAGRRLTAGLFRA